MYAGKNAKRGKKSETDVVHSECRITHSQITYKLPIGGIGSAKIRHSDCRNSQVAIQVTAADSALRVQVIGSQTAGMRILNV